VATSTTRGFCGLRSATGAPTDVNPSTYADVLGMGWDSGQTNIQILRRTGSGTTQFIDLGASFPRPSADRSKVYELSLFCPPGGSTVGYEVTDLGTAAVATGTLVDNLPASTTLLNPLISMSVGGTSSVSGLNLFSLYIETDD
jgi:hypothetical protein